jgi:uncharacterized membrane protein YGL010W
MLRQYDIDLYVYQNGHQNYLNRLIHYICIPIEIFTYSIFVHRLLSFVTAKIQILCSSTCNDQPTAGNRFMTAKQITICQMNQQAPQPMFRLQKYNSAMEPEGPLRTIVYVVPLINVMIGILSLYLSPDFIGLLVLLFHFVLAYHLLQQGRNAKCYSIQSMYDMTNVFILWLLSFAIQIILGHFILEHNQPTFITQKQHDRHEPANAGMGVSWQAIITSVLLAWKS